MPWMRWGGEGWLLLLPPPTPWKLPPHWLLVQLLPLPPLQLGPH